MGQVKEKMIEDEQNADIEDFLKEVVERGEIDGVALGIAKQVLGKGVKSMSEKQKNVIDNYIKFYIKDIECDRCLNGNVSVLTDYIFIKENGLCPMCNYDKEKFMAE